LLLLQTKEEVNLIYHKNYLEQMSFVDKHTIKRYYSCDTCDVLGEVTTSLPLLALSSPERVAVGTFQSDETMTRTGTQ
jgi:hypothetical protein